MRTSYAFALVLPLLSGCDEPKPGTSAEAPNQTSVASAVSSAPPAPAPPPTPAWEKRKASECKPHPSTVDFGNDAALEHEVRRKLGKDGGPITPNDLAQIKSINLASVAGAPLHQLDPCVFPMFTSLKDLFLGSGDYDDLSPIQTLTTLMSLRASLSSVKDLRPIEGCKRLDRLDISHTPVTDDDLKPVGSLVNLTELLLDEDSVSDLTPLANLKKLERLSIKKTRVTNLAPLAGLKSLKFLYIADTPVSDITPVQPLIAHGMRLVQN